MLEVFGLCLVAGMIIFFIIEMCTHLGISSEGVKSLQTYCAILVAIAVILFMVVGAVNYFLITLAR